MDQKDIYKNRDIMLGEIHESAKHMETALNKIDTWCASHDKKDDRRFFIGAIALVVIALSAGVLPEILKVIGF